MGITAVQKFSPFLCTLIYRPQLDKSRDVESSGVRYLVKKSFVTRREQLQCPFGLKNIYYRAVTNPALVSISITPQRDFHGLGAVGTLSSMLLLYATVMCAATTGMCTVIRTCHW